MPFYRLVKRKHVHLVQKEDVEAASPEAAVLLWDEKTAEPFSQFDDGLIDPIEMVDAKVAPERHPNSRWE